MSALAAQAGADTTVIAAMAVGFVSFVSPCVLPLVPGYLSAVSGVSVGELGEGAARARLRVLGPALVFCLSFTAMFVALGMTATGIGSTLQEHRDTLNKVAGAVIAALGLYFVASALVPKLGREWRPHALVEKAGTGGPLIAGVAFAFAWTPCVGPTLSAILTAASTEASVGRGAVLLLFYSAGLAVPFIVTALAFDRATRAFRWFRRHYLAITAASGVILVAMGVLIYTGELFRLNIEAQKLLDGLGINFFQNV